MAGVAALDGPPTVETPRLRLRAHEATDLDACFALWGDGAVTRHIAPRPSTREEVWARLLRYRGHWALSGHGFWLIEDRGGGFVGEVGIADFKREIEPALTAPEAGWVLAPAAQGKGFATEALRAALAWTETKMGFAETTAIIAPDNLPSLGVAARCGYAPIGEARNNGRVVMVHRRQRPSGA